jgi:type VI secretion system secreted protein VgrG
MSLSQQPCTLRIEGASLRVSRLSASEALSTLFELRVFCPLSASPTRQEALQPAALLGATAAVDLDDGVGGQQAITALVAEAELIATDEDFLTLAVVLRPHAYRLTLGRDCRPYHDMSVVDIVADILGRAGIDHRLELSEDYPVRSYTAQYREDDWTFACRLLEQVGIYYWFDHDAGSLLVLADRSSAAPPPSGGPGVRFRQASDALAVAEQHVYQFGAALAAQPAAFSVKSFDPAHPTLQVVGSSNRGVGSGAVYDARASGPLDPAQAQRRSGMLAEGAASRANGCVGEARCVRFQPGVRMQLSEHPFSRFDREYVVTARRLKFADGDDNQAEPLHCAFECGPASQPYRPPERTPAAGQPGLQSARVVGPPGEEIHPDERGRVRIQQHWDRQGAWDDRAGWWSRVAQRGTADSLLLPRMGHNVLTVNEEGSVDTPVTLSRIFDSEHPPPYPLPANKTRVTYRTATTPGGGSYNELRFEDLEGQEELFLNASKDMTALVQNNEMEFITAQSVWAIGHDAQLDVGQHWQQQIAGNQATVVAADESEATGASLQAGVAGNDSATIAGNRNVSVGGTMTTAVTATRSLLVGSSQYDLTFGDINVGAPAISLLVGGALIRLSLQKISESVGLTTHQFVGGAKVEIAKKTIQTGIKGIRNDNVGGAMLMLTQGHYSERALKTMSYNVAGAIAADALDIVIDAKASIKVTCGGSSITIEPKSVTFKAPNVDLSGATIDAVGSTIECN